MVLYFVMTGRGQDLRDIFVTFNRWMVMHPASNALTGTLTTNPVVTLLELPMRAATTIRYSALLYRDQPLGYVLIPAIPAIIAGSIWGPRSRWLALGALAGGMLLGLSALAWWHPHYSQILIPWAALALGTALGAADGWTPPPYRRLTGILAGATGAVILSVVLCIQWPWLRLSPAQVSFAGFGSVFADSEFAARQADTMLRTGETFYDWGWEHDMYFVTRRSPPTGVFNYLPLIDGPLRLPMQTRVIRDLERSPPELILFSSQASDLWDDSGGPMMAWMRTHYALDPQNIKTPTLTFLLLLRRDGRLHHLYGGTPLEDLKPPSAH
jgi:hypothetical protein